MKKGKKADPMRTKTGKVRLGPLSLTQLNELFTKTPSAREKNKIRNRISELTHRSK